MNRRSKTKIRSKGEEKRKKKIRQDGNEGEEMKKEHWSEERGERGKKKERNDSGRKEGRTKRKLPAYPFAQVNLRLVNPFCIHSFCTGQDSGGKHLKMAEVFSLSLQNPW